MKISALFKSIELSTVARFFLGLVFIASAVTKLIAPGLLEIIITDQSLVESRSDAAILVRILIALEFSLGFLLFQKSYLRRIVLPLVFLFLLGFTAYLSYAEFVLSDSQNCGCFGAVLKMNPVESILKNILLFFIALYVYKKTKTVKNKIIIPLVLTVISFPLVFLVSPVKENSGFLFSKYTSFINGGRTDLSSGEKLIFLMTLDCDHCRQTAMDIKELEKKYSLPDYYLFFFQDSDVTVDSFKTITGLNPPYRILAGEEFFELIGTNPPRCYVIKDGIVVETWDSNIKENLESRYKKQR